VEGEVSNLRKQGSGHWYFSLKDEGAQISCAMFGARKREGS
jgi:exodeoxyribonuclease VII large subunit